MPTLRILAPLTALSLLDACGGAHATPPPSEATVVATIVAAPSATEATRTDEELADAEPEPREVRVPELDCTPIKEKGYRRGKRFPITVVTIGHAMVERRTADAYWAMREAAAADGVELPIYSGFRTSAEQKYFYKCFRSCSCNSCIPAAKPGYSNHQSGRALDIGLWPGTHEWMVANAARFGFAATVKSEPWHWEYRPRKRKHKRWPRACPPTSRP